MRAGAAQAALQSRHLVAARIVPAGIDTSLTGARITRVMEQMKEWYGLPEVIRCDNGPEMLSQAFTEWCEANGV